MGDVTKLRVYRMAVRMADRGSAAEAEYWIERAVARGLLDNQRHLDRAREICRMLHGLARSNRP